MSDRPDTSTDSPRRRRRSRVALVSVAAAVLLAGGGGAYWASTAAGSDERGSNTESSSERPPRLTLDGPTEGIAPGEPDPGGVSYKAAGPLPDGPDKAPVYRPQGTVTQAEATRLARALGLPDTPRLVGTAWRAGGAPDGEGPVLTVNKQAPGTWSFIEYGPRGSDFCRKDQERCPDPGDKPDRGPAVSEQVAKAAATPVLKAIGQDDVKLDARQLMGSVRVVNADPVIGGLPTYGWATGIQVGPEGHVVGGSGQLKPPVKGDEYPVIGAKAALERLNEAGRGSGGIGGCAVPVPTEQDQPVAPCKPGHQGPASDPVPVTGAVFGLASHYMNGRQLLVPSWLFEVKPQGAAQPFTITQPAVHPDYLTEPAPPGKDTPPAASDRRVQSYDVDASGRTLTLRFWGGVCSEYGARATESADAVRVEITEKPIEPGRVCILIAKELTTKVTLDKPLGDREVVDAASGQTVPRVPDPSGA
ncbi:membrane protein [Streptomyces sannanensis]|uniref:Membrane protein n=1 Tax=Streptomyces sannanensis TaxID=285536 RepID=A0ABP6S978_9ACTN